MLIKTSFEILFWLLAGLVFYVYAGYPIVLSILLTRAKTFRKRDTYCPSVTLFIPVYNEESVIYKKLQNSLALNYPRDRFEILVVSDGSTDRTNSILNAFHHPHITAITKQSRTGKNDTINRYALKSKGDIIVFSDANSMYHRDAIRHLVSHFCDTRIGCVSGQLQYTDTVTSVGKGEGLYSRYEAFLRNMESAQGAVVTANGAIYALRKTLHKPIPLNVPNDFVHPVQALQDGYFSLYSKRAIAHEKASMTFSEEFQRRIRIVNRGYAAYKTYNKEHRLLASRCGFYFFSHKLLRWHVFLMLIAMLFLNVSFLSNPLYNILFIAQLTFYLSGLLGYALEKVNMRLLIFYIPLYFCMINFASMIGILRYFLRGGDILWDQATGTRANS